MRGPFPPHLATLMDAAAAAAEAGDLARAEPLFREIVALNPSDADAWHMLAVASCRSGRSLEAIELAQKAHRIDRANHNYMNTLGVACFEAGQVDKALTWFRRSLKARPSNAEAHNNLGKALARQGDQRAAEQAYLRALRLDGSRMDTLNNLAALYCGMGRHSEALPLLEEAGNARPDDEAIAGNKVLALLALGKPPAAEEVIRDYLARHPDNVEFHGVLALNLLAQGRFSEGWQEYRWRRRAPDGAPPTPLADELPPDLHARPILLVPDQGIGDQLFFLRFSSLLRDRGARVALLAGKKLYDLLRDATDLQVIARDETVRPEFAGATAMLLGDLPAALGSGEPLAPFPISVSPSRLNSMREKLAALGPPPYVGVTWRAGLKRDFEPEMVRAGPFLLHKEIDSGLLAQALRTWPGTVLVLQRAPSTEELARFSRALGRTAADLSSLNESLADMAALLALVDDYVGVSNTNMHIRAGLGRPARVLIPFPAEFRWMHYGERSPWFPAFTLYRQSPARSWDEALAALRAHLSP